jgi:uncharacterized protein (UPF0335 family)
MAKRLADDNVIRGPGRPRRGSPNGEASPTSEIIQNGRFGDNAAKRLAGFVEEIEAAEERRRTLSDAIRTIYKTAKDAGFKNKIIRRVIADRRRDQDDIAAEQDMIDIYKQALGMLADTPLGVAAIVHNVPTRNDAAIHAAQDHLGTDLPPAA